MKAINNPFMSETYGQIYSDNKGNYYFKGGYDRYIKVAESQIFDDFGNVSYEYFTGSNA